MECWCHVKKMSFNSMFEKPLTVKNNSGLQCWCHIHKTILIAVISKIVCPIFSACDFFCINVHLSVSIKQVQVASTVDKEVVFYVAITTYFPQDNASVNLLNYKEIVLEVLTSSSNWIHLIVVISWKFVTPHFHLLDFLLYYLSMPTLHQNFDWISSGLSVPVWLIHLQPVLY